MFPPTLVAEDDADLGHIPASRKPTFEQIYWLAGVFEGEGNFDHFGIAITQKGPEILYQVRELFGGRVLGPYYRTKDGKTYEVHRWWCGGKRALSIVYTIFHLLSSRRRAQARIFLGISRDDQVFELDPARPCEFLSDWMNWEEKDFWIGWYVPGSRPW